MQLQAVWLVAARAAHALAVHLALKERAVFVILFLYLAVREVDVLVKQGGHEPIEKGLPGSVLGGDGVPPGVAGPAGVELDVGSGLPQPMPRSVPGLQQRPRPLR